MSRYTYAGDFVNPTESFSVQQNPDGEGWIIGVEMSPDQILRQLIDGEITAEEAEVLRKRGWRPHTNGVIFDESEDADEWIEGLSERFEDDYDDYLEENRHAIVQMERYEAWRNEY